jgi:hypothetical protein
MWLILDERCEPNVSQLEVIQFLAVLSNSQRLDFWSPPLWAMGVAHARKPSSKGCLQPEKKRKADKQD